MIAKPIDETMRQRSKTMLSSTLNKSNSRSSNVYNSKDSYDAKSRKTTFTFFNKSQLRSKNTSFVVMALMLLYFLHTMLIDTTTTTVSLGKLRSLRNNQDIQPLKSPHKTCVITISAMNNFGFVWSLYDSIVQNNPDIDCIAWFVGDASEPQEQHDESAKKGFEEIKNAVDKLDKLTMITMKEMEESLEEFDALKTAFMFNLVELQTTLKPFAFQYAFKEFGADAAMYLDNDVWVTSSLEGIQTELASRSAVVTPHCSSPIPHDGRKQTDKNILSSGVYNFGFVAFSKSEATDKFLAWWAERLSLYGFVDPPKAMFYDQNWGMFIPAFFDHEDYIVLRDLRYNIAYWNLHERGAGLHMKDGAPHLFNEETQEDEPVVFMHFSGMSLLEKYDMEGISRHQNRFTLHDFPAISDVFDAYMEVVSSHYTLHYRSVPYGYNHFSDGTKIEPWMRTLYAAAVFPTGKTKYLIFEEEPPYDDVITTYNRLIFQQNVSSNPFCATEKCYTDTTKQRFIDWLWNYTPNKPIDMQGDFYYSYIQDKVWHERPDLQGAFMDPLGDSFEAYHDWFRSNGRESVSEALMEKFEVTASNHEKNSLKFHKVVNSVSDQNIGYNIIGWHAGKAAENVDGAMIVRAVQEAELPMNAIELEMLRGQKYSLPSELDFPLSRSISEPINIVVVDPHHLADFDNDIPRIIQEQKFNVAYWSGDFAEFPENWADVLSRFDEIWCSSFFLKMKIEHSPGFDGTTVKIVHVPLAPRVANINLKDSPSLRHILENVRTTKPFVFYTEFDEDSMKRKNPEAAISAFLAAFPQSTDIERKYQLIVQSNYVPTVEIRKLRSLANNDPRVVFVNEFLSSSERQALLDYQDCNLSLHRSESVGTSILEAIRRKVPVIATNYGAHTNEVSKYSSYAEGTCLFSIPYEMNEDNSHWVEPNQKAAVAALQKVVQSGCKDTLSSAKLDITDTLEKKYSTAAIGKVLAKKVKALLPTIVNHNRNKDLNNNVLRFIGNYNNLLSEKQFAQKRSVTNISLVISHCDKPVDWIPEYITDKYAIKDITIYSKCEKEVEGIDVLSSLGPVETIRLPNVGRCDHSYAYWIMNHYKSIQNSLWIENNYKSIQNHNEGNDIVLFMKDNNYDQAMYRSFDEIFSATSSVGFGCGLKPIWCDCPEGWHQCEENDGLMLHNQTVFNTFTMNHRHVRIDRDNGETDTFTNPQYPDITSWKNAMGLVTPDSETVPVCYGGVFATKKEQLLKQSMDAWTNVEKSLTREDNLVEGHYSERMWGPVLSNIGQEFSSVVDSYVRPHVNQTSSCIGRVGMILIPRDSQVFPGIQTIERSPGMAVPQR